MNRIVLTLATLLLAGCGAAPGAVRLAPDATAMSAASAKRPAVGLPDGWKINDGMSLGATEEKVFAVLPAHLEPTPQGFENLVSDFNIHGKNNRFTFSGVRLVRQPLFVPTKPSVEYFFEGTMDLTSGEVTINRESVIQPRSRP